MLPICIQVEQVVQDINPRGAQAEGNKRDNGFKGQGDLSESVRSDQRHKNDQILNPLMRAESLDQGAEVGRGRTENVANRGTLTSASFKLRSAIDNNGLA